MSNFLFNFILITFNLADVRSCTVNTFHAGLRNPVHIIILTRCYMYKISRPYIFSTTPVTCIRVLFDNSFVGNSAVRNDRALLSYITRGTIAFPRHKIEVLPPAHQFYTQKIIAICFPINRSKGAKVLFYSDQAIFRM